MTFGLGKASDREIQLYLGRPRRRGQFVRGRLPRAVEWHLPAASQAEGDKV